MPSKTKKMLRGHYERLSKKIVSGPEQCIEDWLWGFLKQFSILQCQGIGELGFIGSSIRLSSGRPNKSRCNVALPLFHSMKTWLPELAAHDYMRLSLFDQTTFGVRAWGYSTMPRQNTMLTRKSTRRKAASTISSKRFMSSIGLGLGRSFA